MAVSYRLKKKELIFLLDRLGDVNKLYQKFGFLYLDSKDCMNAKNGLMQKGILTDTGNRTYIDRGFRLIIMNVYTASCVACDDDIKRWIYINDGISVLIETDELSCCDYIITPFQSIPDLEQKLNNDCPTSGFTVFAHERIKTDLSGVIKYFKEGIKINEQQDDTDRNILSGDT